MKKYTEGYKLKENEYMLKKYTQISRHSYDKDRVYPTIGFLAKYNKDGSIPVSFGTWNNDYKTREPLEVYVHTEKPKRGWKLEGYRFGKSQNWARMMHPDGFILEIYLTDLLDVIKADTVVNGELEDSYMWEKNKLIKG
tara:strand:- start:19314 stop:19730 length:417 start_codon:yes stop_codon:yes gene_type:complete